MVAVLAVALPASAQMTPARPFGTLREQAAMQQAWLKKRLDTVPAGAHAQARHRPVGRADARVQRRPGVHGDHRARDVRRPPPHDLRVLRQVRRRRPARRPPAASSASRSAAPRRAASSRRGAPPPAAAGDVGRGQQAELWGDEQWQVLKQVIEERKPKVIGINRSTVFAFSDGLSSGELQGMSEALGADLDGAASRTPRGCRSSSSPRGCRRKKRSSRR